ncbi:MAG: zinc metalloprotease HtpX [Chloroflexi bacterium]|nr:zinc metalloprotease HtpX [Chloroflexota bacterium]
MTSWIKTISLMAALSGLVLFVGYILGGTSVLIFAGIIVGLMNFVMYWFSGSLALAMAGAKQVSEKDEPRLHAIVAEVARRANLPKPKVYIVNNDSPNAFATGRDPKHAVVAVTTGIRRILTDQELEGVLAHEMGHVKNHDMLTMTVVAVLAGIISFLAQMAMFSMIFGGGRRDSRDNNMFAMVGVILAIVLMPIAASLIRFAISRTREYSADSTGAHIINDPLPLASALEKLDNAVRIKPMKATAGTEAMAHMYIVNPLAAHQDKDAQGTSQFASLFSTHPPIHDRIKRLRSMAMG